jgi:hypothetical protein
MYKTETCTKFNGIIWSGGYHLNPHTVNILNDRITKVVQDAYSLLQFWHISRDVQDTTNMLTLWKTYNVPKICV